MCAHEGEDDCKKRCGRAQGIVPIQIMSNARNVLGSVGHMIACECCGNGCESTKAKEQEANGQKEIAFAHDADGVADDSHNEQGDGKVNDKWVKIQI